MNMVDITDSFLAIYKKNKDYYTIYFPELDVESIGFKSLDDSKSFARELLAEILIDREKRNDSLSPKNTDINLLGDEISERVEINLDSYKKIFSKYESQTFIYTEKGDEDKKSVEQDRQIKAANVKQLVIPKTVRKRSLAVAVGGLIICIIASITVANGIKTHNREQKIQESIQKSRTYISSQDYKQGYTTLSDLKDNPETGDYTTEIESLYDYALLKDNRDGDGGDLTIEDQYQYSQNIKFDTGDELYKDAEELKEQIKKEYDVEQQRLAEEEAKQAAITEAKEAKKRREYLEKLSTVIPFSGMEEEFIDCTACGAHSEETIGEDLNDGVFNLYRWVIDGEQVMEVFCKDGKVDFASIPVFNDGSISDYWTDDRKPLFESKKKTPPKIYPSDSDYNEDLDKYITGKEYADEKYGDFMDKLGTEYSSLSKEEIEDIAWVKAFDSWLNMQSPIKEAPIPGAN